LIFIRFPPIGLKGATPCAFVGFVGKVDRGGGGPMKEKKAGKLLFYLEAFNGVFEMGDHTGT